MRVLSRNPVRLEVAKRSKFLRWGEGPVWVEPTGRPLLDRIGSAGAAVLSAAAGVVRWAVMAETAWLPALALIEPLHGLTFALLHLTCMRLLAQCVPRHLEATALTIYGTVGIGIATALLTLACGPIFERFGAHGFWAMAALCAGGRAGEKSHQVRIRKFA